MIDTNSGIFVLLATLAVLGFLFLIWATAKYISFLIELAINDCPKFQILSKQVDVLSQRADSIDKVLFSLEDYLWDVECSSCKSMARVSIRNAGEDKSKTNRPAPLSPSSDGV